MRFCKGTAFGLEVSPFPRGALGLVLVVCTVEPELWQAGERMMSPRVEHMHPGPGNAVRAAALPDVCAGTRAGKWNNWLCKDTERWYKNVPCWAWSQPQSLLSTNTRCGVSHSWTPGSCSQEQLLEKAAISIFLVFRGELYFIWKARILSSKHIWSFWVELICSRWDSKESIHFSSHSPYEWSRHPAPPVPAALPSHGSRHRLTCFQRLFASLTQPASRAIKPKVGLRFSVFQDENTISLQILRSVKNICIQCSVCYLVICVQRVKFSCAPPSFCTGMWDSREEGAVGSQQQDKACRKPAVPCPTGTAFQAWETSFCFVHLCYYPC